MRRLLCLLLLVCLPLQSFAAQWAGVRVADSASLLHQLEHAADRHHHHHDDDTVHYDESSESVEHTDEHSPNLQLSLLEPALRLAPPVAMSLTARSEHVSYLPTPFLDDPQRPPAFAPGPATGG